MKNSAGALVRIATTNKDSDNAILNFSLLYQQDLKNSIKNIAYKYFNYHYGKFAKEIRGLKSFVRNNANIKEKDRDFIIKKVMKICRRYKMGDLSNTIEKELLEEIEEKI